MIIKCYIVNIFIVFGIIKKYGYKLVKYFIYLVVFKIFKIFKLIFGVSIKVIFLWSIN